jgi:hypothetical protein
LPIVNDAHRAQIGSFHNLANSHQRQGNDSHQFQELLEVSNTTVVGSGRGVYHALSVEECTSAEGSGSHGVAGGIGAALRRNPVPVGITVAAALLLVAGAGVVYTAHGRSTSLAAVPGCPSRPGHLIPIGRGLPTNNEVARCAPKAEHLVTSDSQAIVGVCEQVIGRFSLMDGVQMDGTSLPELHALRNEVDGAARAAQRMADNDEAQTDALNRVAHCLGTGLRKNKVEPMISKLETMKNGLLQGGGGTSIDEPINVIRRQMRVGEIDQRLSVLHDISRHLYDATVILNRKILTNAG